MGPVKKLSVSLITGILFSSVISMLVSKGSKKYSVHINNKFTTLFIDTSYYDILFVGSSKVHSNINPKVIDSLTKLKSFNAGMDGANMYEFKTIIDAYLAQHPSPKYIVLGIDLFSFNIPRNLFNYTYYLPYFKNKKIDSVLRQNEHYTGLYKFAPFMRITEFDDYTKSNAFKGFAGKTEISPGQIEYKGFLSLENEGLANKTINIPEEKMHIDSNAVKYLSQIVEECKKRDIMLVFCYAPEYKTMWQNKISNPKEVFNLITEIAVKNKIEFFRDDSLELCNNPDLFYNVRHLNTKGANIYSAILARNIIK